MRLLLLCKPLFISTHAPTRGATIFHAAGISKGDIFLLTPLREGRHVVGYAYCLSGTDFYSRPYARGDSVKYFFAPKCIISTHAPTRGATTTPPLGLGIAEISTHAPTRGATILLSTIIRERDISTHAPTRGATLKALRVRCFPNNFYSRPYARGDEFLPPCQFLAFAISTHAPTRGATLSNAINQLSKVVISTHAPTRGATP